VCIAVGEPSTLLGAAVVSSPTVVDLQPRREEKTMTRTFVNLLLPCLLGLGTAAALTSSPAVAQDVAIANARIIVGNGTVIDSGTLIVRGGRIDSVSAGASDTQGLTMIDAAGLTAMPGFIDAHKHINTGPDEREQMQALLEAGYTTILSGGGPPDGNIMLRDHIESGRINGPRIIPSGRISLRDNTPERARGQVRELAAMGVKFTGEISLTPEPGPSPHEIEVLRAVLDEAEQAGVTVQVHAVSTPAMVAAIETGARRLVHLPNKDWVSRDAAQKLAATNTMILGTIGFGAPVFGVFAEDNMPRFRDGEAWPEAIAGANRDDDGFAMGTEAGYTIVNARTVWDQGGILGYCTDTGYEPRAGLEHELQSYNVVFSMRDIVELMGPNTAAYINMGDELGTLEEGKLADIVLLDGNPMEGYWNMLNAKVVLKEGVVLVDKR
jgi:imidazolonepropionase-like amidohydrolase